MQESETTAGRTAEVVAETSAVETRGAARGRLATAGALLWRDSAALVVVLPLAVMFARVCGHVDGGFVGGDPGVMEMWVRAARHGEAYLGPYSRFKWNHPGPVLFYLQVPLYFATGQRFGGLNLTSIVIAATTIAGLVVVVRSAAGRAAAALTTVVIVGGLFATGMNLTTSFWNPIVVILPLAATGVAAAAVAVGGRWWLPVVAVGASAVVQTHVGTVPLAGLFVAVAVVGAVVTSRRDLRALIAPAAVAGAASILLWALPVFQQVTQQPGNLGLLLQAFRTPPDHLHGLGEIVRKVTGLLVLDGDRIVTRSVRSSSTPPPFSTWFVVRLGALLAASAVLGVAAWRRGRRFEGVLSGLALGSTVVFLWSLRRVEGELHLYLALNALAVAVLLYLSVALGALAVVRPVIRRWVAGGGTRRRAASLVTTLVPVVAAIALVPAAWTQGERRAVDPEVPPIVDRVLADLAGDHTVQLRFVDGRTWVQGALLGNQLERRGHRVVVDPSWTFMFGRQREVDGCPDARIDLRIGAPAAGWTTLSGAEFRIVHPTCTRPD